MVLNIAGLFCLGGLKPVFGMSAFQVSTVPVLCSIDSEARCLRAPLETTPPKINRAELLACLDFE